jgi:hypothetical protein
MKRAFLLAFCLMTFTSKSQTPCAKMVVDADQAITNGNYRDALLKYLAAKKCDKSLAGRIDEKILLLFDEIESLRKVAEKERGIAKDNIQKLADLIGDITDVLQRDENKAVIGLAPLEKDIFQLILPYSEFLKDNSNTISNSWEDARTYYRIGVSLERTGNADYIENYTKSFQLSKNSVQNLLANNKPIPNELMKTLIEAAYYYSWILMNQDNIEKAEYVLNSTIELTKNFPQNNPRILDALSGIENSLSRLYREKDNESLALHHQLNAVNLIEKAISKDSNNLTYQSALSGYYDNLTITPDSLLAPDEKQRYSDLGCELANEIRNTPGSGAIALRKVVECMRDKSYDLTREKKYDEAIVVLNEAIEILSQFIHLDPLNPSNYLRRARIYTRIADIKGTLKNHDEKIIYLKKAKNDLVEIFNKKHPVFPTELWIVKNVYESIRQVPNIFTKGDPNDYIPFLKDIASAFDSRAIIYGNNPEIAFIAADNYMQLGEFARKANYSYDSIHNYLTNAIILFHKSKLLDDVSEYDEKYKRFCRAYSQRLHLNYDHKKTELALSDYHELNELFSPVLDKYPFDFYLRQHFIGSNMRVGELLVNENRFEEAKKYLEYDSKWGGSSSSKLLAKLYREGKYGNPNSAIADSLESLASKQSMKKFTIPCDFGGTKAPFDVYVREWPKAYQYQGIDDQAEWLLVARGGVVPQEVRSSFRKLHQMARKNNISYPDLCAYALGAANKEKVNDLKKELEELSNADSLTYKQKISKYDEYLEIYRSKMKKDSSNYNINNFLTVGFNYIDFLVSNIEYRKAKKLAVELIQTAPNNNETYGKFAAVELADYEEQKLTTSTLDYKSVLTSRHVTALATYYRYFLQQRNKDASIYWFSEIIKINNESSIRFLLFKEQIKFQYYLFDELFLAKNPDFIKKDIDQFVKEIKNEKSNDNKKIFYKYLIRLEEHLLKISPEENITKSLGNHYNSLAWYQLLTGKYNQAERTVNQGLKVDPNNLYFHTNLPAALLFQGKLKKAKKLYDRWKNKPFSPEAGYPTFKEAFLDDFKSFEKEKVIPKKYEADVEKIKSLLNN